MDHTLTDDITASGRSSLYDLFRQQARANPDRTAVTFDGQSWSYATLDTRVRRLAAMLIERGIKPGDRVAVLSENRPEYVELELAAAATGAIVACQNWRLATPELRHCLKLVSPALILVSPRFAENLAATGIDAPTLEFGPAFETACNSAAPGPMPKVDPESGLVILYTSGTTGLPKGALISHRAMIARQAIYAAAVGALPGDGFVAWAPMFHMASTDHQLATLLMGGAVHVIDGYNPRAIVDTIATHRIGWFFLMPGAIEPVIEILKAERPILPGIRAVGAMLDLVPTIQAADLTALLNAPYLNSFGATETGLAPASGALLPPGTKPESLSKKASILVDIILEDGNGNEVPTGDVGEMALRGPSLFSGYWNAVEANAKDFRGGRFHMGDLFRQNADGSYDFVDRAKYMIKSGGENIYPAEIERVLLADPRVREAAVVRRPDAQWGEVPVAFVARNSDSLDEAAVEVLCRAALAGYKRPRDVHFMAYEDFPRSTTGKVLRHVLEDRL